jgi:hypothetical protein
MARYIGPMTKKSRRLGVDLKGNDKNYEKRPYPPGEHGRGRIKESEYLLQLREKQKARYYYGVLEKQFRRYYEEANRQEGVPVRTCSSCWNVASTTCCTGPGGAAVARSPANWSATSTCWSTTRPPTCRRTGSSPGM